MIIYTKKKEEIIVDEDDYDFLNKYTWYINKQGYAQSRKSRKLNPNYKQEQIKIHRLVMECVNPMVQIDHINGNKLDNRKSNLRFVNNSQNQMNSTCDRATKSKIKGVRFKSGKWEAYIWKEKQIYLGLFDNREDAINAYNQKALEFFGQFARIHQIGKT